MKKLIYIFVSVILILTGTWISDGQCQFIDNKAYFTILNTNHHPLYGNGTFFLISIISLTHESKGVKKITAKNSNPGLDNDVYEFSLTPMTRHFSYEWSNYEEEFSEQKGIYVVDVEKPGQSGTTIHQYLYTDVVSEGLVPLPIPRNLRVSFEKGHTTPILSFEPISGVDFDFYDIRIYDRDYSRRIYRTVILANGEPKVTFPASRMFGQTAEELVPGEQYIFRADILKGLYPQSQSGIYSALQSTNFKVFKIPKK